MKNSNLILVRLPGRPSYGDPFASRFTDPNFGSAGEPNNQIFEVTNWNDSNTVTITSEGQNIDVLFDELLTTHYTWRYIDEMQRKQWGDLKNVISSLSSHSDPSIKLTARAMANIFRNGSRKNLADNLISSLNNTPVSVNNQQRQLVITKMLLLSILGIAEKSSA